MDSIIINGDEPKLLQLMLWFDGKFIKNTIVSVQIGSRAPLINNHYYPSTKIYFYVIARRISLPTVKLGYQDFKFQLNFSQYQQKKLELINYELLNSSDKLQQKYWNSKDYQQKLNRFQGLSNFVRSQAQFLALYQRNQQIQQIKYSQQEIERNQKDMSQEIMIIKKNNYDFKMIIILILLFMMIGYFIRVIANKNQEIWEEIPEESQQKVVKYDQKIKIKKKSQKTKNKIKSSDQIKDKSTVKIKDVPKNKNKKIKK